MTNVTASAISSREYFENNIGSVDGSVFEDGGGLPETIAAAEEEEEAVGVCGTAPRYNVWKKRIINRQIHIFSSLCFLTRMDCISGNSESSLLLEFPRSSIN
jgi:hypothetical protein